MMMMMAVRLLSASPLLHALLGKVGQATVGLTAPAAYSNQQSVRQQHQQRLRQSLWYNTGEVRACLASHLPMPLLVLLRM
jgi:hypothetical protein